MHEKIAEKLAQLRAKTDQQLLNFIQSRLDSGVSFAILAEVAASALGRADAALVEAQKLVPALNGNHRRVVDSKLNELREAVDRLGRLRGHSRTQTASMS